MNDKQWEQHVEEAKQEIGAVKQETGKPTNIRANIFFALLSPACFLLAFLISSGWAELLLLSVWVLGGLFSLGVLAFYAYTDKISHQSKEAALGFLLGNLLVLCVFMLKPV